MEKWEDLVCSYPSEPKVQSFSKALQTASVVLKGDLAPFEIDWILQTLLFEPVSIFNVIASKHVEDAWTKPVGDAFKLVSEILDHHATYIEGHYEDIVTLCQESYDAQTKKQALHCLTSLVRHSAVGATDVNRYVTALQELPTCKAPTALLVGAICEHHPEMVADGPIKIWRVYLNLLESNKNTDTVIQAVLQGIAGLLKHFGCDLPTNELFPFYHRLSKEYIRKAKCDKVCRAILEQNADLFKEMIVKDKSLRDYLWTTLTDWAVAGVLSCVYQAIAIVATDSEAQVIVSELSPRTHSRRPLEQLTSLRALGHYSLSTTLKSQLGQVDVYSLETRLRNGDGARTLSYCIETNAPHCDKLVQTVVLFYDKLPPWDKTVVTHAFLDAPAALRTTAILFLTLESCRDTTSLEKYLPIWVDLFNSNNGRDNIVVEKCQLVFEDFINYFITTLDGYLNDRSDDEVLPEKLQLLLTLSSHVLTLQCPEEYTRVYVTEVYELLVRMNDGSCGPLLAAARSTVAHLEGLDFAELYELIQLDRCRDEALLCESCLTLIQAPDAVGDADNVLQAIQIILSRNDVEPKTICQSLRKLESLMMQDKCKNQLLVNQVIHLIENLRTKGDMTDKHTRILRKEVTVFLGKYSTTNENNNNKEMADNNLIAELKDALLLNIQNPGEAMSYKINLQTILQAAIINEEPNSLQTLLVIICGNLSNDRPSLRAVIPLVCRALCSAHAATSCVDVAALQQAVILANLHTPLLEYIGQEKSPGVRRMLSDALEGLLMKETGSEDNDLMVNSVGDRVLVTLASDDSITRRAGLDITESLTVSVKTNNLAATIYLPTILALIVNTYEVNSDTTFDNASTLFIDRIELFDSKIIDKLIVNLLNNLLLSKRMNTQKNVFIYRKIIRKVLLFVKRVFDYKKYEYEKFLKCLIDIFDDNIDVFTMPHSISMFYVLASSKTIFVLNDECARVLLSHKECVILNKLFEQPVSKDHLFEMEAILKFLQEYGVILLELQYQKTLQFLGDFISGLHPNTIKYIHKNMSSCLSTYRHILKKYPQIFLTSLENFTNKIPLEDITKHIENDIYLPEHGALISGLKLALTALDTDLSFLTGVKIHAQKWPRTILQLFSRDNDLRSRMTYLTDLLTVAVKFLTVTDVKKLILEGSGVKGVSNEMVGLKFCQKFMVVFYSYLVDERLLLDEEMAPVSMLLCDVAKFYIRRKWQVEDCTRILELVESLWPTFAEHTTLAQKYGLLLDLSCLPDKMAASSAPLQWVASVVSSRECVGAVCLLPGGEDCSVVYRTFAKGLANSAAELNEDPLSSRALLEALATTGDRTLLDIVASLTQGEECPGWAQSLDACVASLAGAERPGLLHELFQRCWEGLSTGVCCRMMVPLLRYSTQSICIKFFADKQTELLSILRKVQREVSGSYGYHKTVVDYTRAFSILQVAFEKISGPKLESMSSPLYSGMEIHQTWFLVRETCKLCVELGHKVSCSEGADDTLKTDWRKFQCASYSCLTAAIIARRPAEAIYKKIFDPQVWERLVDSNLCDLPLRPGWLSTRPSPEVQRDASDTTSAASTLRSRMFLRTLSENPLMYDLYEINEEDDAPQLQVLPPTTILKHECNTTLYTALCHVAELPHDQWRDAVVTTLTGESRVQVKWLIAQAIVNCKEVLHPHASGLAPAMMALVADTAMCGADGRRLLNGLHMDVVNTLSYWKVDMNPLDASLAQNISSVTQYIISTILQNTHRSSLLKSLVEDLDKFLGVYGTLVTIECDVILPFFQGAQPALKECLMVLKRITKHNIYVKDILPHLMKFDKYLPQSADVFGKTLAVCERIIRPCVVENYRALLERTRKNNAGEYVKMLYYAQMGYGGVCDEKNFRQITNLVLKLDSERSKCLQIISSYIANTSQTSIITDLFETLDICELVAGDTAAEAMGCIAKAVNRMGDQLKRRCTMLVGEYCGHSLVKVRAAAYDVMIEVFEDLFTSAPNSSPKRQKTVMSEILKTFGSKDPFIITVLHSIARGIVEDNGDIRQRVTKLLSKEIPIRFAECFYLTVYQLSKSGTKSQDVSVCLSALLEMVFSELRTQESFKGLKLREEPLNTRQTDGPVKLLTMSKTYQGTLRSRASMTNKRTLAHTGIDVQISIDSILDVFLQFTKTSPEAAKSLFLELMKKLILEVRFDVKSTLSKLVADVMMKGTPGDLTPIIVETCRVVIDDVCQVDGFEPSVAKLKDLMKNTEGEELVRLLHEEVQLRIRGPEQFVLGSFDDNHDITMEESKIFSVDGLQSAFGKLSNWDQLTLQQKPLIERDLPTLWTSAHAWDTAVGNYSLGNRDTWFQKMVAASSGECKRDSVIWLREMDRWPRSPFESSAVIEAIQYQGNENQTIYSNIHDSDCLAKWAARLMIRSSRLSQMDSGPDDLLMSHSHELSWTVCANERGLPNCALDCIKRNTIDLYETETLAWLQQKVLALRLIGLKGNDSDVYFRKALDTAEKYTPLFIDKSPNEVVIGMKKCILQLTSDLKSLTNTKLQDTIQEVSKIIAEKDTVTRTDRRNIECIYQMAITHYDDSWIDEDSVKQNDILKCMCEVLNGVIQNNITYDVFLSVIFNRLDDLYGQLDENTARALLSQLQQIWPTLDQFSLDELKRHLPLFGGVTSEFGATIALLQHALSTGQQYRQWFQLICDAGHTLLNSCAELGEALHDANAEKWRSVFDRMKQRIFENPYAGTDYRLLLKYKHRLDQISDFDADKSQKEVTLNEIQKELLSSPVRKCLRLSQLCPSLCNTSVLGDQCMTHMLGLSRVSVVRIDEQITVFTDSIRRPCVFRVLLSNGTYKRYLHKSGEQLRVDAAAQRVGKRLARQWGGFVGYNVTPLSEDSGLIEYLEDYERVRTLLPLNNNIDSVTPRADRELVLAPSQASVTHHQRCRHMPAHALRSVIEGSCCTTQDFIVKKHRFLESISSITLLCWLFGLGDRHLQNILYNRQQGTLCCVDWAAIFQYGVDELPPARLTRIFLAVIDLQDLESRLQMLVEIMRQSHKLLIHTIHESFKWMGREFDDKEPYIELLLEGKMLPHEVTKDAIVHSTIKYIDKYIELLDNVFYRYEKKECYSVQEQVSNLLQHCTDPKILGVTRSGWEPWL